MGDKVFMIKEIKRLGLVIRLERAWEGLYSLGSTAERGLIRGPKVGLVAESCPFKKDIGFFPPTSHFWHVIII